MEYRKINELLKDCSFLTELLNGVCRPRNERAFGDPIPEGWIDEQISEKLTEKYRDLSAQDGSFINAVIVVHDPALNPEAVTVEHSEDRFRYILLTLIPDAPIAYQLNFPLHQTMGILTLISWEFSRASTAACREMARVDIVKDPMPPILNNADVEWASIYIGRDPFAGRTEIDECYKSEPEDGTFLHLNLYKAREMEANPVLDRLIEAYDADVSTACD